MRRLEEADLSVYRRHSLSLVTLVACLRYPAISGDGWVWNLGQNCPERHCRRCYRTSIATIHLCLIHTACHQPCWLPRLRLQVTVLLFGTSILILQFYVLLRPRSSRYCSQPLLANLVGNMVFTMFALGLFLLLAQTEMAPWALRTALAGFGVASFGEGVCSGLLTLLASDCEKTTPELYYVSVLLSVGSLVSTVLFAGMGLICLFKVTCPRPDAKPTV